ncbi:acetate--CoA ligase family protein [Amycolatopsis orientalis]|uniref:acetate--CoA ligase family protein n=1 Tax=Amycolatopsis orientalis TaxID=31958 RepID=UPI0006889B1B|nr:acetate--CoA ligase family protein [Amycolatopsis orientalis]
MPDRDIAPESHAGPLPRAFVDPASVAVVGATADPAKWGYWLASGALLGARRREVWLVNRRATDVLGHPSHATVADVPGVPELVVLCVPAAQAGPVVRDALAKGSRAFLGISAEIGPEVTEMLARAGARMLGPNSLGLVNTAAELRLAWGAFRPGHLAVVSQSGQLGSEIARLGARAGLGVSRFYSVGNQLGVRAAEVLASLSDDPHTHAVALYLESFADGPDLVAAVRKLRSAGKPTLVLAAGASEGSRRLARSHTGSMTSSLDVVDAACRASGALRVATPRELVDTVQVLDAAARPAGPRVAIVSDSGGQGGIAADIAAAHGLQAPTFTPGLRRRLRAVLPAAAATANPIDLAGAGEADLAVYARIAEVLAASGEVDAVVLSGYLGCYGEDTPGLGDAELAVIDRLGRCADKPIVVHSMSEASAAVTRLRKHRIPVFDTIDAAVGALSRAVRLNSQPRPDGTGLPADAGVPAPGYWAAREFLSSQGIAVPTARRVLASDELAAACAELRPPLVLKAGWLAHKSEHGAIETGLDRQSAAAAFDEMRARLGPGEYVLEEQDTRPEVVEMLVGARTDPDFGPTVAVAYGGVEAELWRDVATELAPVDHSRALAMIDRLRARPLLDGWRGRPAVRVEALADAIVRVSRAIASHPGIGEIEVNPIRVGTTGAMAVDALVVASATATEKQEETDAHVH